MRVMQAGERIIDASHGISDDSSAHEYTQTRARARTHTHTHTHCVKHCVQVDSWGVVVCCWLHMSRVVIQRLAEKSPVLLGMSKADAQACRV